MSIRPMPFHQNHHSSSLFIPSNLSPQRSMALNTSMSLPSIKSTPLSSPLWPPAATNVGLCRPPPTLLALKSSFYLSTSLQLLLPRHQPSCNVASAAPKFSMRMAAKQAYICRDCGYIYNEKTPFEKLPDKYFCPVCGAPKRRFRPYSPPVTKDANVTDVRKARKAELQRDEAIGKALPIAIVVGVAALAGLYFYLNSTF